MKKFFIFFILILALILPGVLLAASPVYVWDGSAQDDGDATWNSSTIAYLTLELALAAVDAGGIINVASEHSQTQASALTLGSANDNVTVISVDKDNSDVYLAMVDDAAPGKIETTGNNSITFNKNSTFLGLTIDSDQDMIFSTNTMENKFINCKLLVDNITPIGGTNNDSTVIFENVNYEQTGNGRFQLSGGGIIWKGGTFSFNGGMISGALFQHTSATRGMKVIVADVDFQDLDAGDYLVDMNSTDATATVDIKRSKVPAALAGLITNLPTGPLATAKFHSVSNSNIIHQLQENTHLGQINEDTGIYLDATYDGTNGYAAKLVSNANAIEWTNSLEFKLADIWSTANPTITVELLIDSATTLNNDDVWLRIQYPDGTTGALGLSDISSRMTNITDTPSELTTSAKGAGDWTGEGGTAKFYKISVVLANGQTGVHTIYVNLAKPSTTIYTDPKLVIS